METTKVMEMVAVKIQVIIKLKTNLKETGIKAVGMAIAGVVAKATATAKEAIEVNKDVKSLIIKRIQIVTLVMVREVIAVTIGMTISVIMRITTTNTAPIGAVMMN